MPKFRAETRQETIQYKSIYIEAPIADRAELLSQRLDRDDGEEWHDGLPAAELESDELPEVLSIEANDSDVPPDLTEGA